MEKINIAELLKNCAEGMELDCTMFYNVTFEEVITVKGFDDKKRVKIILSTHYSDGTKDEINLTEFGTYTDDETAKCVIFPKGKTTWEGFVPPCKFKDGDIVYVKSNERNEYIIIFKEIKNDHVHKYACFAYQHLSIDKCALCHLVDVEIMRFATEEEREKLFQAIKEHGYKWNEETKTLEKLVEPKFKVGDKIRHKCPEFRGERIIANCNDTGYFTTINDWIGIANQDDWELVPNKFDINTLVPFESRVLVRGSDPISEWKPAIFGTYRGDKYYKFYVVGGNCWKQCIPYEGNEHLMGTTNSCDEYFKTWK